MKIPPEIISELERCIEDLSFGHVNLEVVIHDRRARYRIIVEKSYVPGRNSSGSTGGAYEK